MHATASCGLLTLPVHMLQIDVGYLSAPEAVEFLTENGNTAFMNFYAPKNKDYKLPDGHKAPLLVKIHGGPTSQASTGFNLAWQFWTSRGEPNARQKC